jgi:adenylate cyclase
MRFRTKLWLVFVAVALLTSGFCIGMLYQRFYGTLLHQYQARVLSIAASTASLIPPDLIDLMAQIKTSADETSDPYHKLRDLLRRVRNANRNADPEVRYINTDVHIYTLRQAPSDPSLIEYVVDAEDNPAKVKHVGDGYREPHRRTRTDRPGVDSSFSVTGGGHWLSANVPLKDRTGKVVGAVGVRIAPRNVGAATRHLQVVSALALLVAVLAAFAATYYLSGRTSVPLAKLREAVEAIGGGNLDTRVDIASRDEFGEVGRAVNTMVEGLRERDMVKSAFARYVSRQVMDHVLASREIPTVKGDRRRITVLFSDIRGFTTLAEHMRPEDIVQLLDEYFEMMVAVVFRNQGTLDKFIGDGLMVFFGAPLEDPLQEEHAVTTALEMQRELRKLGAKWQSEGRPPLRIGIGINSGNAVVGNIGATERMEYTAIGDTVNLASRLETATREVDADILVSEYTYNAVRGLFPMERIGPIKVKGRADEVVVYSVRDSEPVAASPGQSDKGPPDAPAAEPRQGA